MFLALFPSCVNVFVTATKTSNKMILSFHAVTVDVVPPWQSFKMYCYFFFFFQMCLYFFDTRHLLLFLNRWVNLFDNYDTWFSIWLSIIMHLKFNIRKCLHRISNKVSWANSRHMFSLLLFIYLEKNNTSKLNFIN